MQFITNTWSVQKLFSDHCTGKGPSQHAINPMSDTGFCGLKQSHCSCWAQDMKPAAGRGGRPLCRVAALSSSSTPGWPETPNTVATLSWQRRTTFCSLLDSGSFQLSSVTASNLSILFIISVQTQHETENRACTQLPKSQPLSWR